MPKFLFTVGKTAVQIAVSLGVSKVLSDVIRNNTVKVTTIDKILVAVGGTVLGFMLADQASDYVGDGADKVRQKFVKAKQEADAKVQ